MAKGEGRRGGKCVTKWLKSQWVCWGNAETTGLGDGMLELCTPGYHSL